MTGRTKFQLFTFLVAVTFIAAANGVCLAQNADNTKINERDQTADEVTADEQGQTPEDLKLTQDIRKAIIDDKSLSMNAHNVKIITLSGVVTLKGPVDNDQESKVIETLATHIAGVNQVKNQINVMVK